MPDTYKGFTVADLYLKFEYVDETGDLVWREPHAKAGEVVGAKLHNNRTTTLYLRGKKVNLQVSRIIYGIVTGEFPPADKIIRFKDQNPLNTKFENMELITREEAHLYRKKREKKPEIRYLTTSCPGVKLDRKEDTYLVYGEKEVKSVEKDFELAKFARWNWEFDNKFVENA
jgi:hypothetical protein